jgi:hypothetical protein
MPRRRRRKRSCWWQKESQRDAAQLYVLPSCKRGMASFSERSLLLSWVSSSNFHNVKINCMFFLVSDVCVCVCLSENAQVRKSKKSFRDRLSSAPWLTIERHGRRLWKWEMKQPRLTRERWPLKKTPTTRFRILARLNHAGQYLARGHSDFKSARLIYLAAKWRAYTTIATAPSKQKQRDVEKISMPMPSYAAGGLRRCYETTC